jgi:hypothetical protein
LQFIAREDGDFNAYKGMVTERFYNTNCFQSKGMMLTLSHAWCIGVILYSAQESLAYSDSLNLKDTYTGRSLHPDKAENYAIYYILY